MTHIKHPEHCPTCGTPLERFTQELHMINTRHYMAHCVFIGCPKWMHTFTYHTEPIDNDQAPDMGQMVAA